MPKAALWLVAGAGRSAVHGVLITARSKAWVLIRLENGWLERNACDGGLIQSANIVVYGLGISVNKRVDSVVRSIRVSAQSQGCHIIACYLPLNRPIRAEDDSVFGDDVLTSPMWVSWFFLIHNVLFSNHNLFYTM